MNASQFVKEFTTFQERVGKNARVKGWWERPREPGEVLMNIVGEVAEAWEGIRKHNPQSEKIPNYTMEEEELADVIIRIMDWSNNKNLRIAEAIVAKHLYNLTREYRHGGKAY